VHDAHLLLLDSSSGQDEHRSQSTDQADSPTRAATKYTPEMDVLLLHVQMFAAACKFGNPGLKKYARKGFLAGVALVTKDGACCLEDIPDIQTMFHTVYQTTSAHERDLRDVCLREALVELYLCGRFGHTCKKSTLRKMLEELPDLAVDLSTHYFKEGNLAVAFECRECKKRSWWFRGICMCGHWHKYCDEQVCVAAAEALTQCIGCGAKGTGTLDLHDEVTFEDKSGRALGVV
jgi:hypothetical protein